MNYFWINKKNSIDINFMKVDHTVEIYAYLYKSKMKSAFLHSGFPGRIFMIYIAYMDQRYCTNVRGFLSSTGKINKGIKET